jgi:hypothetical protein
LTFDLDHLKIYVSELQDTSYYIKYLVDFFLFEPDSTHALYDKVEFLCVFHVVVVILSALVEIVILFQVKKTILFLHFFRSAKLIENVIISLTFVLSYDS